jgi:uncharacterized protein (TIGR00725 family)
VGVRIVIGVMGSGAPLSEAERDTAYRLGRLIAESGWVLVTGGRACGVMDAASQGAREAGGLVLGVLPDADLHGCSPYVDVPVLTGIGDARNLVNALTSRVLLALPGGPGTVSEVALALKAGRTVLTVGWDLSAAFPAQAGTGQLRVVADPDDTVAAVRAELAKEGA